MKKNLLLLVLGTIALVATKAASATSPDLTQLAKQKRVSLSSREARVARIGKISDGRQVSGGLLGTYPGFGLGHVAQGRWQDDGKFFTYSQLGAVALMAVSGRCVGKVFSNKDNDCGGPQEVLLLTGLIGYVGLRVWEIIDVWKAPGKQNRRYQFLKDRLEKLQDFQPAQAPATTMHLTPMLGPAKAPGVALVVNF